MKNCPFCAEEIQDEAKKCRHCGSQLDNVEPEVKKKKKPSIYVVMFGVVAISFFAYAVITGVIESITGGAPSNIAVSGQNSQQDVKTKAEEATDKAISDIEVLKTGNIQDINKLSDNIIGLSSDLKAYSIQYREAFISKTQGSIDGAEATIYMNYYDNLVKTGVSPSEAMRQTTEKYASVGANTNKLKNDALNDQVNARDSEIVALAQELKTADKNRQIEIADRLIQLLNEAKKDFDAWYDIANKNPK